MLRTLSVKNLALVEQVSLELRPGLNMITGETGAGKSILVGALGLLLGERADKTMIRAGADACSAEAVFDLADSTDVDRVLETIGVEPCRDGELIIRRVIKSGGGQALVNDHAVTLQVLKRIGDCLVDMHGPHDHQSLLKPEAQLAILDAFGRLQAAAGAFKQVYDEMRVLEKRREALAMDEEDVMERIDGLRYRVQDIRDARLAPDEEERLTEEHRRAAHAQQILELSSSIGNALTEEEACAFDRLAYARRVMGKLARFVPEAESWADELEALTVQLQEVACQVGRLAGDVGTNPERVAWLDERIATYHKLKKKYGPTVADVIRTLEESEAQLQELESTEERLEALDAELAKARKRLEAAGQALHEKRGKAAGRLAQAITQELQTLGFPRGTFTVEIIPCEPHPQGMDRCEFGFAPNAGEPMRPLRSIASSGEISRVMLATKSVLADHDRMPVLVFDEIDANLGGEMGHAVGEKLAAVAAGRQVLCITHLPQVAVFGTSHFVVEKQLCDGRTVTQVRLLADAEARAEEVARMLGGRDRTSVTLAHARALLQSV